MEEEEEENANLLSQTEAISIVRGCLTFGHKQPLLNQCEIKTKTSTL